MSQNTTLRRSRKIWNQIGAEMPERLVDDASDEFLSSFIASCEEGMTVLDLGCGAAHFLELIQMHVPEAVLLGSDISNTAITHARRKVPEATFKWGYAHSIPFADESCDRVWCRGLLHFCPKDNAVEILDDAFRVLKPGGLLYLRMQVMMDDYPKKSGWFDSPAGAKVYHAVWKYDEYVAFLRDTNFELEIGPVEDGNRHFECVLLKPQ